MSRGRNERSSLAFISQFLSEECHENIGTIRRFNFGGDQREKPF